MTRVVSDVVLGALAEARALGFLGPGPIETHVASAEQFATAIEEAGGCGPALDLGSGGGVPGLLLAVWFPEWPWVLFDAHRRRTSFLAAVVTRAGLAPRVSIVRERAEAAAHDPLHRERYGIVTARSFGPPAATAEAASGFLREGGIAVVAEPPGEGNRWDDRGLATVGLTVERSASRGVRVLRKNVGLGPSYPRQLKQQRARPLF